MVFWTFQSCMSIQKIYDTDRQLATLVAFLICSIDNTSVATRMDPN